jgi:hypothetical protein
MNTNYSWVARDINGTALENAPFEQVFHHPESEKRFMSHLPVQGISFPSQLSDNFRPPYSPLVLFSYQFNRVGTVSPYWTLHHFMPRTL